MHRRVRFMHRAVMITAVAIVSCSSFASPLADEPDSSATAVAPQHILTINVVDGAGKPVPGAEAFLVDDTYGLAQSKTWQSADANGVIHIAADNTEIDQSELTNGTKGTLIVRAPGMAWATASVTLPAAQPVKVTLTTGHALAITIKTEDGRAIPKDLSPIVFAEGLSVAAWSTNAQDRASDYGDGSTFSAAIPEPAGEGRFIVHVPGDVENVWVLVHHPGFMRAFQAGPFDGAAIESGSVTVTLPKPATIAINITPAEGKSTDYEACGATLMMTPQIPDGGWAFRVFNAFSDAKTMQVTLNDIAPGNIGATAFTGDKETRNARDREDYFEHSEWFEITAGEEKKFDVAVETFNEESLRASLTGDNAITIKVSKPDGSPAVGQDYELSFSLRQFGKNLTAKAGTVPENGEIVVDGLPLGDVAPLEFSVNGNYLGWILLSADDETDTFEFHLPPGVGEMAPDLVLTRLDNDEDITLSSLRGQVVFLDFWASWCGPCQEPMAHNNELVGRRTDWQGNAVIVGASIDNTIDIIKEHVGKREWTNVLQVHCGEGDPGWGCDAIKKYAVTGVPTCFLIDREGKIAWTGHPASIDVEAQIDALIAK